MQTKLIDVESDLQKTFPNSLIKVGQSEEHKAAPRHLLNLFPCLRQSLCAAGAVRLRIGAGFECIAEKSSS